MMFPLILVGLIILLALGVVIQSIFVFEVTGEEELELQDYETEDADVEVAVGDGYFQQVESDLDQDVVEVERGEIIRFYNEGDIPHTVTIPEYNVDEFLNPGEEVFVEAEKSLEESLLDCTLHAHHEGTITVD